MVFSSLLKAVQNCDKQSYEKEGLCFDYEGVSLGYVLPAVVEKLKGEESFLVKEDRVSFREKVNTVEKRTAVMAELTQRWREQQTFQALASWRDELYPVYGVGGQTVFVLERAAAPLFGISTFGVHLNAFVRQRDQLLVWVARRAKTKPTWPGALDNCVAGGIPYLHKVKQTVIKECDEEASIPEHMASKAQSATVITYYTFTEAGLQPETQYIYDLELAQDFTPTPRDGEVECFYLWSLAKVKKSILDGEWKPNCAAVMIEFMMRHGFITPDNEPDYIEISYHLHRRLEFPTPLAQ
ncbi:NUDIX hydrolase domain-like protein [Sporodiniella umbellata]|nr:NUDIX hydrolase domain-like protein [Sporodiniella umbellata]